MINPLLGRIGTLIDHFHRSKRQQPLHLVRGQRGEKLAERYLRGEGYKILARRYQPKHRRGDIDLVAREKDVLVFVEVKTRGSEAFGRPLDAVKEAKRRHVRRAALEYLQRLGSPRLYLRFDVVEVVLEEDGKAVRDIRLTRNVFDLGELYRY